MTRRTIIKNATLFDGLGSPPRKADLAFENQCISAINQAITPADTDIVVDADGLGLAPGIIDTHTHYDAQITWDPWVDPSVRHGVTTVLIGNCGFTIAPCRERDRDLTMKNLVRVEGMSLDALRTGTNWSFESFRDYMQLLDNQGLGVNVGAYVGHSSIRTYVMGDAAAERAATDEEIQAMRAIVVDALHEGAIGFATSTSPSHNGALGPMPSRLACDNEMRALVGALGETGKGIFMLTKGPGSTPEFLESLAADTGRPVMIAALLHNSTRPDATFNDLAAIGAAQSRGNALWGQVSCCPLTTEFTLEAPYPLEGIESWKPALTASPEEVRSLFADPGFRRAVTHDLQTPLAVRLFNGEWDKVRVVETRDESNRHLESQTIADIAAEAGTTPLDAMLDLALAEDLKTLFVAELLNSDEQAVGKMLCDPYSSIALSDAGAHLTFFCDAGFGLRLMGHWARDRKVMTIEQAVYQLTGLPAKIYGLENRGRLEVGAAADLMLFDPRSVNRSPARRAFDLPGGAYRLTTDPLGVHAVWVNGEHVVQDGQRREEAQLAGTLLREFAN